MGRRDLRRAQRVQVSVIQSTAQVKHAHHTLLPHWLIQLGAVGLFAVSAIDASVIPLALPGSTDLLLLFLVAHRGNPWLLAGSAIAGSVVGAYLTWSAGKSGGEALLKRMVPKRLIKRVSHLAEHHSIASAFLPAVLPPPIPLMPFLLAAGAFGVSRKRFVLAFSAGRIIRYGLEAWAGVTYGRRIVRLWTKYLAGWSDVILWAFFVLLIAAIAFGIWQYKRQQRSAPGERAFA